MPEHGAQFSFDDLEPAGPKPKMTDVGPAIDFKLMAKGVADMGAAMKKFGEQVSIAIDKMGTEFTAKKTDVGFTWTATTATNSKPFSKQDIDDAIAAIGKSSGIKPLPPPMKPGVYATKPPDPYADSPVLAWSPPPKPFYDPLDHFESYHPAKNLLTEVILPKPKPITTETFYQLAKNLKADHKDPKHYHVEISPADYAKLKQEIPPNFGDPWASTPHNMFGITTKVDPKLPPGKIILVHVHHA